MGEVNFLGIMLTMTSLTALALHPSAPTKARKKCSRIKTQEIWDNQ